MGEGIALRVKQGIAPKFSLLKLHFSGYELPCRKSWPEKILIKEAKLYGTILTFIYIIHISYVSSNEGDFFMTPKFLNCTEKSIYFKLFESETLNINLYILKSGYRFYFIKIINEKLESAEILFFSSRATL